MNKTKYYITTISLSILSIVTLLFDWFELRKAGWASNVADYGAHDERFFSLLRSFPMVKELINRDVFNSYFFGTFNAGFLKLMSYALALIVWLTVVFAIILFVLHVYKIAKKAETYKFGAWGSGVVLVLAVFSIIMSGILTYSVRNRTLKPMLNMVAPTAWVYISIIFSVVNVIMIIYLYRSKNKE